MTRFSLGIYKGLKAMVTAVIYCKCGWIVECCLAIFYWWYRNLVTKRRWIKYSMTYDIYFFMHLWNIRTCLLTHLGFGILNYNNKIEALHLPILKNRINLVCWKQAWCFSSQTEILSIFIYLRTKIANINVRLNPCDGLSELYKRQFSPEKTSVL